MYRGAPDHEILVERRKEIIMYPTQDASNVIQHIELSRQSLGTAIAGLSETQSNFKPAPNRWSIAETLEHIATVEERVIGRISQMLASAPGAPDGRVNDSDSVLITKVLDRTSRFQAPEPVQPTGKPLSHSMERLAASRQKLVDLVRSAPADFRERTATHPALGPLDAHQWLIAVAGHCGRHTAQINETKAASGFPAQ
jgi:hypothetical protein